MSLTIIKKSSKKGDATPIKNLDNGTNIKNYSNMESVHTLNPSLEEATKFLSLLAPDDISFTFLTFDDNSDRKAPSLTCVLHGSHEEHFDELVELNRKGAGIFVTVNKTNGKGRKKEDIVGIRAIFQEADNGNEPELPCDPHIVVESSPGKFHRYILTEGPKADYLDEFEPVQQRMVDDYGSDLNAKDRARVLRLPGYYHQKVNSKKGLVGTPHMIWIVSTSGELPYSWDELKKIFPPVEKTNAVAKHFAGTLPNLKFELGLYDRVLAALDHLNPDDNYEGWLKVGMALHTSFYNQMGLDIWINWSKQGAKFQQSICENKWKSFQSYNGEESSQIVTVASIFYMAKQCYWDGNPVIYSEKELEDQILNLDKEDDDAILEIHNRICKSIISKKKKNKLHRQLEVVTEQTKKDLDSEIKEILSKKSSQQDIVALVIQSLGKDNQIFVTGVFYFYKNGCWVSQEEMAIRKCIQDVCDCNNISYTKSVIDGAIGILKGKTHVSQEILDTQHPYINCLNGEVEITVKGHIELHQHTREHYYISQIPVEYDPDVKAPRFEQYLDEIFAGCSDKEKRKLLLLEFIGYSLLTNNNLERFIILLGSGSNGKSVFLAILERLLGKVNVCSIPPSKLGEKFITAQLVGKLANIVTEIAVGEKIDDAKLKSMVSGELLTAERKGKDHFEFRPYATMFFATNHMPHTKDYSEALLRRTEILTFPNTFEGKSKDTGLIDKLIKELPGIFNLSLTAIANALKRGDFTQCPSSQKAKKNWVIESDQAARFVEDYCKSGKNYKVSIAFLYEQYKSWCEDEGIKLTLSKNIFSQRLSNLGFPTKKINNTRYKIGLKLLNDSLHSK